MGETNFRLIPDLEARRLIQSLSCAATLYRRRVPLAGLRLSGAEGTHWADITVVTASFSRGGARFLAEPAADTSRHA